MIEAMDTSPDPRLASIIRRYSQRRVDPAGQVLERRQPARTKHFVQFSLAAPVLIHDRAAGTMAKPDTVCVVGPQSYRWLDVVANHRIDLITVDFMPTGLHRLVGLSIGEIENSYLIGADLFGRRVDLLAERLAETATFPGRARLLNAFFLAMIDRAQADGPFALAAARLWAGDVPVAVLAAAAEMSPRHFTRQFRVVTGMTPKRFARVSRLQRALHLRQGHPRLSWTELAHVSGYFDQAHMIRDFHDLADTTPSAYSRYAVSETLPDASIVALSDVRAGVNMVKRGALIDARAVLPIYSPAVGRGAVSRPAPEIS